MKTALPTFNVFFINSKKCHRMIYPTQNELDCLLHFLAFFHLASMLSTEVDNKKVGVNEKALELDNRMFFL